MSAETSSRTGKLVLSAGLMGGVAYVASPVACLIALEMVERPRAARRQRPPISVTRVKAVVHMTIEAAMAVEPWTSPNEQAADKPIGPIVAVGRAVIGLSLIHI